MLDLIFNFFANYLIEFMASLLIVGLGFRWASYRQSNKEDAFFSSFTAEVEKNLLLNKEKNNESIENVEKYIDDLLDQVKEKLPTRNIRNADQIKKRKAMAGERSAANIVSLREYATGDQSLYFGIKSEMSSFKSKFPPNFTELTNRILEHDDNWNKVLSFFPIGPISRLIDVLPGLFVVFGIFGTFIGISMALPRVAEIDFNNIDSSGVILKEFVLSVTYAMKTSIAGILFSLVMTFLNTLAPVSGLRRKTHKKVQSCFENLWHCIHGAQSVEERISKYLPLLFEQVSAIKHKLIDGTEIQNTDEKLKKEA